MIPQFTGRIVEWDIERGCGWVEAEGQRIFLHWREFETRSFPNSLAATRRSFAFYVARPRRSIAKRRKRPSAGDEIRFTAGTGPTGEICAKNAVHLNSRQRIEFVAILLLLALLLSPALGVVKLRIDPLVATAYALLVNGITYAVYASDKKRACQQQGARRTPEATLHLLELIGGWPGAFVAQRRLRHKCVKLKFQIVFWLIVAIHQYVAFGFLQGWELPKTILRAIRSIIRLVNPAFW